MGGVDVERFLLVAKFAQKHDICNEKIDQAACIYDHLTKAREQRVIEKILEGKSVAVVGNGPSELGKSKGREIDSHDIVIRFNNYAVDGYENDYGTKTNIWVRGGSPQVEDRSKYIKYLAILWEPDYEHFSICFNNLDILYRDVQNGVICSNFDYKTHLALRNAIGMHFSPTTGLLCIHWLLSLNLKKLDFYGFSFLDEFSPSRVHYYEEDDELTKKFMQPHSLDRESEYLKRILNV